MKAYVDKEGCISCGLCVEICPDVFQFDEDGVAYVVSDPVPEDCEDCAVEAQENCPVSVIKVEQ
ncbi:MAG: ferredoxin [Clostridiales bacterium]|nr:ferredoxin [Clostridiales bacterium]